MDRQDAKPRRPSLMAGVPSPAIGPSPARILADMDGGKTAAVSTGPAPRRKLLILAAAAVSVFALLWWWQSGSGQTGFSPADAPMHPGSGTARMENDAGRGAATIIEETSPASGASALLGGADGADTSAGEDDPLASPFAASAPALAIARSERANPFTPGQPARARTAATSASPAARARTSEPGMRNDEPDLMATLLGNIKTADAPPASGLDTLIQKMESDGASAVAGKQTASTGVPPTRSQQIQSNLRECPPANTAKGLKCRQAICAVYAGRDPACPAN